MRLPKPALCGCLMDAPIHKVPGLLQFPGVDLVEWRMDVFSKKHSPEETFKALPLLSTFSRHPVLATNRPRRQWGAFEGPEGERLDMLHRAVDAGAEWVDLEEDISDAAWERFLDGGSKTLISHHDFSGTPDQTTLMRLAEKMAWRGPNAIKIVTYARTSEDNLKVLELIPYGKKDLGIDVIAFCMGPMGRWSRLVCILLGSPWTYVELTDQGAAAPGQFTAAEMKALLSSFKT